MPLAYRHAGYSRNLILAREHHECGLTLAVAPCSKHLADLRGNHGKANRTHTVPTQAKKVPSNRPTVDARYSLDRAPRIRADKATQYSMVANISQPVALIGHCRRAHRP